MSVSNNTRSPSEPSVIMPKILAVQLCGEAWRSDEMSRVENALHIATENDRDCCIAAVVGVRIFGHILSGTLIFVS